jgi:4-amino-4-deoxy-L-arabinose transferase-like glycosyltransferase
MARWTRRAELVLILGLLIGFFVKNIQYINFEGDESQWIKTSHVLGPFLRGDFSSPAWDVSYWTLTHPPLPRYIIGIGRRIGGFQMKDLNTHWRFNLTTEENIALGAMPSPGLLWWSRMPMAILAAVSGVLLFFLTSRATGRVAGYVLLLLFVLNGYLVAVLSRAMGDSPLVVFVLLAAVAGYQALNSWQRKELDGPSRQKTLLRTLIWFAAMGVFCGLAAGAKLNGGSVMLAGFGLCVLFPVIRKRFARLKYEGALFACVLVFSAAVTFVALNPFLYPNPLDRTTMMVQHRLEEMSAQQRAWPDISIDKSRRFPVIQQRVFESYATLHFSGAQTVNLLLCIIGIAYLLYSSYRWLQNPSGSGAAIVILLVACTTTVPTLFTPIDWERYYLLPVVFSTALIAIGVGWLVTSILGRAVEANTFGLSKPENL